MCCSLAIATCVFAAGSGSTNADANNPVLATTRIEISDWASSTATLRADWKTFGNGPSHTGYFPDTVRTGGFTPEWTSTLTGDLQQVAVADGRVFVTPWQYFSSAWLAALDESSGALLWNHPFNSCYSINPPTFDGGFVYVQRGNHGSDTQLWSIVAETGVTNWSASHAAQWERYMAPTIADGKIWVNGGYYGGMYGFEQAGGAQLFFQGMAQIDGWTPGYFAGTVYTWLGGVLRAHDRVTGAVQWSLSTGMSDFTSGRTSSIANGRAFFIGSSTLYAVDLTRRAMAWTVNGNFVGTPAVANGVVYAMTSGWVNAYDAWNGAYIGVYVGTNGLIDQPIVTDDALVFSAASKTFVYDRQTFTQVTTIPYGGQLSLANGRLYIATGNGALRAYQALGNSTTAANLVGEWEPWVGAGAANRFSARLKLTNYGSLASNYQRSLVVLSADTTFDPGDAVLKSIKLAPLAIGETLSATVLIKTDAASTGRYVLLVPDCDGLVPETNENNTVPSGQLP